MDGHCRFRIALGVSIDPVFFFEEAGQKRIDPQESVARESEIVLIQLSEPSFDEIGNDGLKGISDFDGIFSAKVAGIRHFQALSGTSVENFAGPM